MLLNRNLRRKAFLKFNYNLIIMIIVISNLGKCLQSLYKKRFFQNYLKEIALTCKLHKAYMTQCSSAFTLLLHRFVFIPFTLPPALSYSNIHTSGTLSIAFTYRHTQTHTHSTHKLHALLPLVYVHVHSYFFAVNIYILQHRDWEV